MKHFYWAFFLLMIFSCTQKNFDHPHIVIETTMGDIEAELYPDKAPKSVAAFTSYIDSGFFKDASFYRVLREEDDATGKNTGLIQAGLWPEKKTVSGIEHESTKQTGLSHTNGILSLARTAPGTATTEFFICIGDQTQFNAGNARQPDSLGYAAFGKVVKGMDIVRVIQSKPVNGDHFVKKINIKNITIEYPGK